MQNIDGVDFVLLLYRNFTLKFSTVVLNINFYLFSHRDYTDRRRFETRDEAIGLKYIVV